MPQNLPQRGGPPPSKDRSGPIGTKRQDQDGTPAYRVLSQEITTTMDHWIWNLCLSQLGMAS